MTCAKNRLKKRKISEFFLAVIISLICSATAIAQDVGVKQYQRQATLGGKLPVVILLIGYSKDANDIEKLFDIIIAKANETFARLDLQNPASDAVKINAQAGKGPVQVPEDVAEAFETAKKLSDWTGGAFDIVTAGDGNWKDIKVSRGSSAVEIKKPGVQVNFDSLINGFMAELISRYIYASKMQNAIVKVGNVFRGIGTGLTGPWVIQVEDDAGTFAHHALNLSVANTGVATVSASAYRSKQLVDPRSKHETKVSCRGVVVVMNDAALAEGIANAVFLLGPQEGMKLLTKFGKGLIVDSEGKFIRSPGF